jgi:Protein of unknown function (DUF2568)
MAASMKSALQWLNVGLRVLMECGIVAAMGCWGYGGGHGPVLKILLGLGAPLLVFGFWGAVDFRGMGRAAEPMRLFQELALSGLAALAWYAAGWHSLGWTLALVSLVHHALVYLLGGTLLKPLRTDGPAAGS